MPLPEEGASCGVKGIRGSLVGLPRSRSSAVGCGVTGAGGGVAAWLRFTRATTSRWVRARASRRSAVRWSSRATLRSESSSAAPSGPSPAASSRVLQGAEATASATLRACLMEVPYRSALISPRSKEARASTVFFAPAAPLPASAVSASSSCRERRARASRPVSSVWSRPRKEAWASNWCTRSPAWSRWARAASMIWRANWLTIRPRRRAGAFCPNTVSKRSRAVSQSDSAGSGWLRSASWSLIADRSGAGSSTVPPRTHTRSSISANAATTSRARKSGRPRGSGLSVQSVRVIRDRSPVLPWALAS